MVTPLVWEVGFEGSGQTIVVEPGFVTDFASIPWLLQWVWPPMGRRYRRPSALHDKLRRMIDEGSAHPLALSRRIADGIFLEAMAACGVTWIERWTFWAAVRIYTIIAYREWRGWLG